MRIWLLQHYQAFSLTLKRLLKRPLNSLFNILVISFILALPFGGYLVLDNLQSLIKQNSAIPQISLFLEMEATKNDIAQTNARLKKLSGVKEIRFISREQALNELKQSEDISDVLEIFNHNPLPDAFVIYPRNTAPQELEKLAEEIHAFPKVVHVQLDSAWAKRLNALLKLIQISVILITVLLSMAVITVIFNTLRLQILTQREEIEVSQLFGATSSFIYRPFFYLGIIQAGLGGILTCVIVLISFHLLNRPIVELSQLYGSNFRLLLPNKVDVLLLIVFACFLGWLGSLISVRKHLHH